MAIEKVENILLAVAPLAKKYSHRLRVARQDEQIRKITLTRAVINLNGSYELSENQPFVVPSSIDFVKLERDGHEFLATLSQQHNISLKPGFYVPEPNRAFYVPALELRKDGQGILITLGSSYLRMSFDPRPYVDAIRPDGIYYERDGQGLLSSSPKIDQTIIGTGTLDTFITSLR